MGMSVICRLCAIALRRVGDDGSDPCCPGLGLASRSRNSIQSDENVSFSPKVSSRVLPRAPLRVCPRRCIPTRGAAGDVAALLAPDVEPGPPLDFCRPTSSRWSSVHERIVASNESISKRLASPRGVVMKESSTLVTRRLSRPNRGMSCIRCRMWSRYDTPVHVELVRVLLEPS